MKKYLYILPFSFLLLASTCRRGLTYKNLYSNNLNLILVLEKEGCYEAISYSQNNVLNSTSFFPTNEKNKKDYILIDSFIAKKKAFILNTIDSSFWVLDKAKFDDKKIFIVNEKNKNKDKFNIFKECQ